MDRFKNSFKNPYIMAGFCTLVLSLWMLSGVGKSKPLVNKDAESTEQVATTVQIRHSHSELVPAELTLQGQLKPIKTVNIGSEAQGKVIQVLVDKGVYVKKDQALFKLDMQDRQAKLNEAQALYTQRKADFESVKTLVAKDIMARNHLHEKQSLLAMAESALKQIELDIEHTTIRASFDGFVNNKMVEVGDYVQKGDKVATLVDNKALLATAHLHSKNLSDFDKTVSVLITPTSGSPVQGKLHFLSKVADENTRSYEIEFLVPNTDLKLTAGASADIVVKTAPRPAHFISSALFNLNEQGELGVKTVGKDNKVEFHIITPLKSTTDGSWVTGLAEDINLITVGQGFVSVGDTVKSITTPEIKANEPLISQDH